MLAPPCQRCKLWIAQLGCPRLGQFDKSMPEAIFQQVKGYQAAIRRFEKIITREQVARRVGILVQAVAQSGTKQGRFKKRSEEQTSELQSLMPTSYDILC